MNEQTASSTDSLLGTSNRAMIVAEIGLNFDGDQALALEMIEAAAFCGVDAVKFQVYKTDEFVFDQSSTYEYTLASGEIVRESEYEMFKRHELSRECCRILKSAADNAGLVFFSSVADEVSCNEMGQIGMELFKIASVDLPNEPLLRNVGRKRGGVILSTGMANEQEIKAAISTLLDAGALGVSLLHCVSVYPTPTESANIQRIVELRERFGLPVGFSDHTENPIAATVAVGVGCTIFEKHFTLDQSRRGPDHRFSADPSQMSEYVKSIRLAELAKGEGGLGYSKLECEGRKQFRCSIHARTDIGEGVEVDSRMLAFYRPGTGLQPYEINRVVGRKTRRCIPRGEMIRLSDLI